MNGALLIDKPAGISSFGIIEQIQRALSRKYSLKKKELPSFGHGGTLDPFATGLLVVFAGEGVKLSRYFLGSDKRYEGTIAFGEQTESADFTTPVSNTSTILPVDLNPIQKAADTFVGTPYAQIPPMYSAKKQDGVRLYEMAREGKTVEREAKILNITEFKITEYSAPMAQFQVSSSSGTYIRTLAEDLARKLGTLAHLKTLRRLAAGPFEIEKSTTLESLLQEIEKGTSLSELSCFVPFHQIMNHFDILEISSEDVKKIRQGNRDTVRELNFKCDKNAAHDTVVVLKNDGKLVAVMRKTDLFFELERVFQV